MRRRILGPFLLFALVAGLTAFALIVPDWHLPVRGYQVSEAGPSLVQFEQTAQPQVHALNTTPPPLPPPEPETTPATQVYQNVKVLTDTDAGQFIRLQHAITAWVSPKQGCGFCHEAQNYASDAKPAKQAARTMLRMVRGINTAWQNHVGQAGVTCWTCHRGQPVPAQLWFPRPPKAPRDMIAKQEDWNEEATTVHKFFPAASWDLYLRGETSGSGQAYTALPSRTAPPQIVTKRVYEVMMQMSDEIGVNCGYCHNSRAFFDWKESTPARWVGYYGIQMTRALNRNVLEPLATTIPQVRDERYHSFIPVLPPRDRGLQAGNGFVICGTCHYGLPKPTRIPDALDTFPTLRKPDPLLNPTPASAPGPG
ncbi:MAG: photosynthetic reaction center cytochrome c subunit [Acetobacteraceae bacterium]|nr:photosynthetic reaction center cytochrome c subunit [Acetobacteraceae bacterium]